MAKADQEARSKQEGPRMVQHLSHALHLLYEAELVAVACPPLDPVCSRKSYVIDADGFWVTHTDITCQHRIHDVAQGPRTLTQGQACIDPGC